MTRLVWNRIAPALLGTVLVFAAAPLSAQTLQEGAWGGTLTGPNGQGFDVTLEVSGEGDDLSVVMIAPTGDTVEFDSVMFDDEILKFEFSFPGVTVSCELEAGEAGSYVGDCVGSDGQGGTLEMRPPAGG